MKHGSVQSPRARHIQHVESAQTATRFRRGSPDMAERGRMAWRKAAGYGGRNQAEAAMARYKHLISPRLRARDLLAQQGEVAIAVAVLNTMIRTAKPASAHVV